MRREVGAVLALYVATLMSGYNSGFSAVAAPDMKAERR